MTPVAGALAFGLSTDYGVFCVAVGALVLCQTVVLKEIGLAAALAVLINSSVVRALLVPSLMAMLGPWN